MKLYSGPLSMFGAKAQIALREKGLDAEVVMVPFNMRTLYDPKHEEVLRVNPKAQVPVLIDGDLELFDSTQIFEYLEDAYPRPPLWPGEPKARARARQAELISDEVFFPHCVRMMPLGPAAKAAVDPAGEPHRAAMRAHYEALDARLGDGYLAGPDFTYADIAFVMAQFFAARFGAPITDEWPRLADWRRRVHARPAVAPVLDAMRAFLADVGTPAPA